MFFRQQFGSIFSEAHPLTDEEAADQWSLIAHDGGSRIGHRLISYMDERERRAERWHGALRDWPKPLSLAWGMVDPVATMNVLEGSVPCARRRRSIGSRTSGTTRRSRIPPAWQRP